MSWDILLVGRFITALGSSAGLVCTFIILNRSVDHAKVKIALSFASVSFALSLTLAVFIGGMLETYLSWVYCFYVLMIQGVVMYAMSFMYTDTLLDKEPLHIKTILCGYRVALSNVKLVGFSVGVAIVSVFSYCYSVAGPFIANDLFGFNGATYGVWNCMTFVGIVGGSIVAAKILSTGDTASILKKSLVCMVALLMLLTVLNILGSLTPVLFFVLMTLIFAVCGVIYPASSYIASNSMEDKSSASGIMNFINMGLATVMVSVMGYLPFEYFWNLILLAVLLPFLFLVTVIVLKPKV
jgi:MFS family permease